jgi:hypothetical protein
MKRAALGFRMHSGWGVLVALAGGAKTLEVIDRRRIVTIDPKIPGAKQPYHFVETFELPQAREHLQKCATSSERLARAAVEQLARELSARDFQIVGAAVILASGRVLPPLQKILAAHPLLHTAEGEFFREAVRKACQRLKIPVTGIRERDLDERATTAFGISAARVQNEISNAGKVFGPPWTKDHKTAALAAAVLLAH